MRIEVGGNHLYDLQRIGQSAWLYCSDPRTLAGSQFACRQRRHFGRRFEPGRSCHGLCRRIGLSRARRRSAGWPVPRRGKFTSASA